MSPPIGASSIHIGFGWPVAVPLTLPFASVAMRLGPVLAGPVHSCVGAAGRFAAVCCVGGGGGVPRDKIIIINTKEGTGSTRQADSKTTHAQTQCGVS